MPSQAEQIAARIAAVLTAQAAAIGLDVTPTAAVYRDRVDAFERTESPAAIVEIDEEDAAAFGGNARAGFGMDAVELRIHIIYCARSANWQTVLDGVRSAAHSALMADATLQALCNGSGPALSLRRTSAQWAAASTDVPFGSLKQAYVCKYLAPTHLLEST